MSGVLTGTLSGGGAMTGSMAAGMVANKKPGTYTVTPETLAKILKMAEPGATIKLSAGEYGRIDLHGQNAYPEDCTFIGCEGATVAGVSITSGVISDTLQASADISDAILPQGLTFEGVAFTDSFCLRNARVDNLTLDNCRFGEKTNISISPECFVDAYGDDRFSEPKGNGSMYRFPYAHLKQKNLVIRDCELVGSTGTPQYENGQASAINVVGVDGVTIYHNETNGGYNGIQVGGQITDYGVLSCGKVSITKNTVKNTTTRGINVHSICDGDVTIAENALESINHDDKIIVRYCDNTTLTWDVWNEHKDYSKPNTCDGKAIAVGSGIVVAETVTSPSEYHKNLIDLDGALDSKMDVGVSKYNYSHSEDTDEEKLNEWLDNTVLPSMANNTIRNISIRCGGADGLGNGIIPWPAMGTIHKHTHKYATIDVTTQIHGKHYTKVRGDTGWQSTVCETDKLNAKAPGGYGLGTGSTYAKDLNTLLVNGWYYTNGETANLPDTSPILDYANVLVLRRTADNVSQLLTDPVRKHQMLRYTKDGGASWVEEWVNPPMAPGVEYRTTERWNGKTVYTVLINCGIAATADGMDGYSYTSVTSGFSFTEILNHRSHIDKICLPYGVPFTSTSMYAWVEVSNSIRNTLQINLGCHNDTVGGWFVGKNLYTQVWYTKD